MDPSQTGSLLNAAERELAGILSGVFYSPGTVRRWLGPAENQGAKALDKVRGQAIMLDEEAHVDRTVQRIEKHVEVSILV